jgi:hypothetical protein
MHGYETDARYCADLDGDDPDDDDDDDDDALKELLPLDHPEMAFPASLSQSK